MKALKALSLLAMMAATTSCSTYSLEELRHTSPSGSAYQNALAARYLDMADNEARNYDWNTSGYFADKGLLAAYGKEIQPETLDSWSLPESSKPALADARTDLMNQLTPEKISQKPEDAADAVAYFDCWVENEEEAWQTDEIAYCRDRHLQAVARLKEEPKPEPQPEPEPAPEPAPAPVIAPAPECPKQECPAPTPAPTPIVEAPPAPLPAPAVIEKQAYLVMFQFNKSSVDDNGKQILDAIVRELKKLPHEGYQVVVNGHTDTVGSARYNMELSKKRADVIRRELMDRGVPLEKIEAFGFGETDLRVKTKDGVKEQANRRVEIFVGDDRPVNVQQHDAAPAPSPRVDTVPVTPVTQAEAPATAAPAAPEVKAEAPAAETKPEPQAAASSPEAPASAPLDTSPPKADQTFANQIRDAVKEKEMAAAEARLRAEEAVKAAEQADKEAQQAKELASKLADVKPSAAAPAAPSESKD